MAGTCDFNDFFFQVSEPPENPLHAPGNLTHSIHSNQNQRDLPEVVSRFGAVPAPPVKAMTVLLPLAPRCAVLD